MNPFSNEPRAAYSASCSPLCLAAASDQRLQLTALIHLNQDVAAANQFAVHPQLREGWPVSIFRQFCADIRVLQNINIRETFTTGRQRLYSLSGEAAASESLSCTAVSGFQRSGAGFFVVLIVLLPSTSTADGGHCNGSGSQQKITFCSLVTILRPYLKSCLQNVT